MCIRDRAGAALGVFFKTKDKDMKGVSLSAAITGFFGITEPAIYGVNLRLKKPMICGCIAGAVGGAIGGAFNAVSWGYNMPGIATLPAYFKSGHMNQFIGYLISIAVAFVLGIILTFVVGFAEDTEPEKEETTDAQKESQAASAGDNEGIVRTVEFGSPVAGDVIPVTEVKDAVFASEMMGKGVGIIPAEGKVYAPCDGTAEAVFPTGHAVGLKCSNGLELLIHIGIDTVKLEGRGFKAHVNQGDHVKKGDLLVEFDRELVKENGYDPTVIFIVTAMDQIQDMEKRTGQNVKQLDTVMTVTCREE